MKRKIAVTVLLLLLHFSGTSQVILVSFSIGECPKYQAALDRINPAVTGIPTYIIFESRYEERKADLEEIYHFTERGFITVFSDNIKAHFPQQFSSRMVLLYGDSILYKNDLVAIDSLQVANIVRIDKEHARFSIKKDENLKFIGNTAFAYDYTFKELRRRNGADDFLYRILLKDIKAMARYGCMRNAGFDEYEAALAVRGDLRPKCVCFYPVSETEVYLLVDWYQASKKDGNVHLRSANAVFHYINDKLVEAHPVDPGHRDTSYFLDINYLVPLPDNKVLLAYKPKKVSDTAGAHNKFIALFALDHGCYKFIRHLPFELPDAYRKVFGHNFIEYFASDDRYVAITASDEIVDIQSEETYKIPLDSFVRLGELNMRTALQGSGMPVLNTNLVHKGDLIYVMTKLNRIKYLYVYNVSLRSVVSFFPVDSLFPGMMREDSFVMSPKSSVIYIGDKNTGKVRAYPFSFLNARMFLNSAVK